MVYVGLARLRDTGAQQGLEASFCRGRGGLVHQGRCPVLPGAESGPLVLPGAESGPPLTERRDRRKPPPGDLSQAWGVVTDQRGEALPEGRGHEARRKEAEREHRQAAEGWSTTASAPAAKSQGTRSRVDGSFLTCWSNPDSESPRDLSPDASLLGTAGPSGSADVVFL